MRSRVAIVSSFTLDSIDGRRCIGGPAYYSTVALLHYCSDDILLVGPAGRVHEVFAEKVGARLILTSREVPLFELRYVGGRGDRVVRLARSGGEISISSRTLEGLRGSLIIVSPVYREVSIPTLRGLRGVAGLLALDIQGLVRETGVNGVVRNRWDPRVYEAVKLADVVHADLSEAPTPSDAVTAAELLSRRSRGVVMVSMGASGLIAVRSGEAVYVPALPDIEGDATGTGDILLSIAAYELSRGGEWLTAIARGTAAAGLKVGRGRPPWFSRHEVEVLAVKLLSKLRLL